MFFSEDSSYDTGELNCLISCNNSEIRPEGRRPFVKVAFMRNEIHTGTKKVIVTPRAGNFREVMCATCRSVIGIRGLESESVKNNSDSDSYQRIQGKE